MAHVRDLLMATVAGHALVSHGRLEKPAPVELGHLRKRVEGVLVVRDGIKRGIPTRTSTTPGEK
jgi:hypothetical protein